MLATLRSDSLCSCKTRKRVATAGPQYRSALSVAPKYGAGIQLAVPGNTRGQIMGRQQVPIDQAQRTRSLQIGIAFTRMSIALPGRGIGMSATMPVIVAAAFSKTETRTA